MSIITQSSTGVRQFSLPFQGESGILGPYLLSGKDELALIDPGPGSTLEALLASLGEAGFSPEEVTHLLITHIHLDHAGAVGALVRALPRANVFVHSKGAPHLVDPSRLVASAARIYGDTMQELWGEILPVPEERVRVIDDGDVLSVAGRRLEVHYTPGHAIHHVVFFDVHSGDLFAGDIAGVRLQDIEYVQPATPPPDLHIEQWSSSIDKLKYLRPDVLYLAHFGPTRNVPQHLEQLREKLFSWGDLVLSALRDGKSEAEIIDLLTTRQQPELQRASSKENTFKRYELAGNYAMTVQGYIRYWHKIHGERL